MLFRTPFEAICKFFCTLKTKNYGVPTETTDEGKGPIQPVETQGSAQGGKKERT
jgi:hypothetical protein